MPDQRLRTHPENRLDPTIQLVDLPASAQGLRAEAHHAVAGHRQVAVFRHGPVTLISFVFEAGGTMKEHQADGVVTIHALSGHLRVAVGGQLFDLTTGRLLGLGPRIPHTVSAIEASEMLLTVHKGVA